MYKFMLKTIKFKTKLFNKPQSYFLFFRLNKYTLK